MEPKNQVIWTTRCKVMAKYISIYFDIFYEKLVYSGSPPARSKNKNLFINYMTWTTCGLNSPRFTPPEPPKKMFLSENVIFRGLIDI